MKWDDMRNQWIRDYVQHHDVTRWVDEFDWKPVINEPRVLDDASTIRSRVVVDDLQGWWFEQRESVFHVKDEDETLELPPLEEIL